MLHIQNSQGKMTTLSTEQIIFLNQQGIPRSKAFDATGMKTNTYRTLMSDLGMTVAFGVTPCHEAGHQMRARGGHCVMCKTASLGFQARFNDPGFVYAAHSIKLNLVKIGTTGDTSERIKNINYYGYGGASDWVLKYEIRVDKAGQIEWQAQKRVENTRAWRSYVRDGFSVDCQELFDCDVTTAIQSINESIELLRNS